MNLLKMDMEKAIKEKEINHNDKEIPMLYMGKMIEGILVIWEGRGFFCLSKEDSTPLTDWCKIQDYYWKPLDQLIIEKVDEDFDEESDYQSLPEDF